MHTPHLFIIIVISKCLSYTASRIFYVYDGLTMLQLEVEVCLCVCVNCRAIFEALQLHIQTNWRIVNEKSKETDSSDKSMCFITHHTNTNWITWKIKLCTHLRWCRNEHNQVQFRLKGKKLHQDTQRCTNTYPYDKKKRERNISIIFITHAGFAHDIDEFNSNFIFTFQKLIRIAFVLQNDCDCLTWFILLQKNKNMATVARVTQRVSLQRISKQTNHTVHTMPRRESCFTRIHCHRFDLYSEKKWNRSKYISKGMVFHRMSSLEFQLVLIHNKKTLKHNFP